MSARRAIFLVIFLVCSVLLAIAFYMEHVQGLEPCPLCWLQRYAFMAVGAAALLGAIHDPGGWGGRLYGLLTAVFAGMGLALAGRQIWLQSLPEDQVPACGPSVDYLLDVMPLFDVLRIALQGTGDCAEVVWRFLGLSIPGWTAVFFSLVALVSLALVFGFWQGKRLP